MTKSDANNYELARLEYQQGRYRLAIQFAQYWLAQHPEDAGALELLGLSKMRLNRLNEGIEALEEASLLAPLSSEAQVSLAAGYGSAGRKSLSKDLLMSAATSGRLDEKALLAVAAGLEAIDEPVLAMEACRQAGVLAPESAEVHYQMGYYTSRCDYPACVVESLIRHSIALDPDNLHYRIGLASLLIRLGRSFEAIATVKRFIPARIDEVTCECCLKRLANLFFDCDDMEVAQLCAARLSALKGNAHPGQHRSGTFLVAAPANSTP